MNQKYDTIIIGAGIAGLLTALRLARFGQRIIVVDKDKIGTGSTFSNHGMIHSGALYVRQHGHIVRNCQEAQQAFLTLVGEAEIPAQESLYIASKENVDDFVKHLEEYSFDYTSTTLKDAADVNYERLREYEALTIKERVFSSKAILEGIASNCLDAGVEILLGSKIEKIVLNNGMVKGVIVGSTQKLECQDVVIAAGLGTTQFLRSFNSVYAPLLKSRLDMMVYLPQAALKRGLIFADLDKPILMPAKDNSALGSFFGGIQPQINGDRKFSVDYSKSKLLFEMIDTYFDKSVVNTEDAVVYTCGKTDYTGADTTEKGFINPGFHIIDHQDGDAIRGLHTIITGKMTLAFHASKAVTERVLNRNVELILTKGQNLSNAPESLFTVEPWSDVAAT